MSIECLREELLDLVDALPFTLFVGEVFQRPKIEEPDGFDDAPIVGYIDAFPIGWVWKYKDERYGNFFYIDAEKSAKEILGLVVANFEHAKDAIKEGTWTAQ